MPDLIERPHLRGLWLGFLFAAAAVLCNAIFFLNPPAQRALPWLSVVFALIALPMLAQGAKQAFARPGSLAIKVLCSVVLVVSLGFVGITALAFVHARHLPSAREAPQVGDQAPEFTLADTTGQPVSLAQLFEAVPIDAQAVPPKDVLLIFYRGYW